LFRFFVSDKNNKNNTQMLWDFRSSLNFKKCVFDDGAQEDATSLSEDNKSAKDDDPRRVLWNMICDRIDRTSEEILWKRIY